MRCYWLRYEERRLSSRRQCNMRTGERQSRIGEEIRHEGEEWRRRRLMKAMSQDVRCATVHQDYGTARDKVAYWYLGAQPAWAPEHGSLGEMS